MSMKVVQILFGTKTNEEFWRDKLRKNQIRDNENYAALRQLGWKVIIVWDCELVKRQKEDRLNRLIQEIKTGS